MKHVLDYSKPHQKFFEEISKVPRGSWHEELISAYVENFAQERGLRYVRDFRNNVIVYKDASEGYEDHPTVALQAHMDMVCEKDEGYDHDFSKDPIRLKLEDGFIKAIHTTLGADNGSGVSYMLAVLDNKDAKHPPLECIFTVQEEVGMHGAIAFDKSLMSASRFISLDCGGGDGVYISSLGGRNAFATLKIHRQEGRGRVWRIKVEGLTGSYSVGYMKGKENAIAIAGEFVREVRKACPVQLIALNGGEKGPKAARKAEAVFATTADETEVRECFEKYRGLLEKELAFGEPDAVFSLEQVEAEGTPEVLTEESAATILNFLALLPCGVADLNARNRDSMGAVSNWLYAETGEDLFTFHSTIRGDSTRRFAKLTERFETLCAILGLEPEIETGFPPWEYDPNSYLLSRLKEVFREKLHRELHTIEVQGGIESSIFMQDRKLDMISLGAHGGLEHTPKEWMELSSFDDIYEVLNGLLEVL